MARGRFGVTAITPFTSGRARLTTQKHVKLLLSQLRELDRQVWTRSASGPEMGWPVLVLPFLVLSFVIRFFLAASTPPPPLSFDEPRFGGGNILALTGFDRISVPMSFPAKIQARAAKTLA